MDGGTRGRSTRGLRCQARGHLGDPQEDEECPPFQPGLSRLQQQKAPAMNIHLLFAFHDSGTKSLLMGPFPTRGNQRRRSPGVFAGGGLTPSPGGRHGRASRGSPRSWAQPLRAGRILNLSAEITARPNSLGSCRLLPDNLRAITNDNSGPGSSFPWSSGVIESGVLRQLINRDEVQPRHPVFISFTLPPGVHAPGCLDEPFNVTGWKLGSRSCFPIKTQTWWWPRRSWPCPRGEKGKGSEGRGKVP